MLKALETWRVSVIAMNGLAFDLSTPHGRMMATIIAGIAEFERELIQERIRSGIAAAKARGKRLGRQPRAAAEIRPSRVKGDGARRHRTQLSLDRARGRAEQEYRSRHRQTSSRQYGSDRVTATLHLVT
jgi:DNA invertase Pin-like site-specific DNA recombinase